jgi:hypothetical protein
MDDRLSMTDLGRRASLLSGSLAAALACTLAAGCVAQPIYAAAQPAGSAGLARQVELAVADASRRFGINVAEVKVQIAEPVTWLDGSLGCPERDLMYTQTLVPGYRIRISAGDQRLDYHADSRGEMLLCPPERSMDPSPARR